MTTCPRCGTDATGNFCSSCGALLGPRPCPSCGGTPEIGARFCNHCGAPVGGAAAPAGPGRARRGGASAERASAPGRSSRLVWGLSAAFVVVLAVMAALPILRRDTSAGLLPDGSAPFAGSGAGGTPPDLGSMTPRQAADRLFQRVMTAHEAGNTAEVQQFLPMAIQAHEMAAPLDLDGRYHLALLHNAGGDFETGLATARSILDESPTHLLGLAAAAEAAKGLGDPESARGYYQQLLDAYGAEVARGLPEYTDHAPVLEIARDSALAATSP